MFDQFGINQSCLASRVGCMLVGRWHLDALVDVGGMAAVYAATHRDGMRGAIKIPHPAALLNSEAKARFLREGHIARQVTHPNALRILEHQSDDESNPFVVMELLDGATLRECAQEAGGRLAAEDVLLVADQLLDVLDAVHRIGIVHRDIKPENVFLTTEGQAKLIDFGIAGVREHNALEPCRTVAGLLMGSPAYMAPEQARGRWDLVDERSDLWSVGATMFTLLSGREVHTEETVLEMLAAVISTPAPSLATVLPDAHPDLVRFVDRALQMVPADRWPNARAMRAAVHSAFFAICGKPLPSLAPEHAARDLLSSS